MAPAQKPTLVLTRSRTSSDSSIPSLQAPRTPRFAEATAVNSPIEPSKAGKSPFDDPPETHFKPQPQPSDVGFGYISDNNPVHQVAYVPISDEKKSLATPLKSAMKVPGTPGRKIPAANPLSPTFKDEQILSPTFREEKELEKREEKTDKQQVKDLKQKTRVRMGKMLLRYVNFSCSLIILALIATTFTIFNATKAIPPRNGLPPWAKDTKIWPQVTLLCMACISLFCCLCIFWGYRKGGHKRAEKAAVYYNIFAMSFFVFTIVMWGIAVGILQSSKNHGNGQDVWGWSCKDNKRRQLFQDDVAYGLICRLQDWSLICVIIEIVVEVLTITIYAVVFYRFYSKKRLHKTMDGRDKARNDLYLAQLRTQTAPNTPGLNNPMSPGFKSPMSTHFGQDAHSKAEEGDYFGPQFAQEKTFSKPKPFALQPPPIRVQGATPTLKQDGFAPAETVSAPAPKAPGEQTFASVPIPGAYMSPTSPSFPPQAHSTPFQGR